MTKKHLLLWGILALIAATTASAYTIYNAKRGHDAFGKQTEAPRVAYTGDGEVTVRFAAEKSPRLAKWWNGRLVVNCPVGYHFVVIPATSSEHENREEATCEPNRT